MLTKILWRRTRITAEKTRKIGRITKAKIIRDLADRHAGIQQPAFGFEQHALMQDIQSATAIELMAQGIQVHT